jgi:hypothetical protein
MYLHQLVDIRNPFERMTDDEDEDNSKTDFGQIHILSSLNYGASWNYGL